MSERVRVGSVRVLRCCEVTGATARHPAGRPSAREVSAWIDARLDLDPAVRVVVDETEPGDEPVAVCFTVTAVRDVAVDAVSLLEARACGWWTLAGLRAAWAAEHPQMQFARLVGFALGDLRDTPRLVSAFWPDYTSDGGRAMRFEPEAVSRGEESRYARDAQQRYLRSRADLARDLAACSISERLAAIQAGSVVRTDPQRYSR